jgi:purine nucleoside permease
LTISIDTLIFAAFEPDSGPIPGELRYFIEREDLTETLTFEAGYRPLHLNRNRAILACTTGVGSARAAASVMALGLDPRFDLTQANILITGVAGIDPARGSLASVVLPEYVVDGDLCHEIDAREIPSEWPDGFVPIGKSTPYEQPLSQRFNGDDGIVFRLNPQLVAHAFGVCGDVQLLDTPTITRRRQLFSPAETARKPPSIIRGDELSSTTFWHGKLLSQRACAWVEYQSSGQATYAITAMEDAGILQALTFLAAAGRIDFERVLIVRAAANHDQQRDGLTATESLAETRVATDSAYLPALENAWRVGHRLIDELRNRHGELG